MGISTAIAGLLEGTAGSIFGTGGLLGVLGTTVATGAIEGAALGTGVSALEGKNLGKGALLGGLTGGIGGAATSGLEGLGASTGLADFGGGLIGGTSAGLLTGQNLSHALKGGIISGGLDYISGALGKPATSGAATGGGGASSAASTAAPASVGAVDPNAVSGSFDSGVFGNSVGSGGGGAGLPGSVGTGAAGEASTSAASGIGSGTSSIAPSAPGIGDATPEVVITAPTSAGTPTNIPAIDALGPVTSSSKTANDNSSLRSKMDNLTKNPALLLGGGLLAANTLMGNKKPIGFDNLSAEAQQQLNQSRLLESYQASGTLPPGLQAGIDAATQNAAAAIKSQYASRGMSGSSAEAQDLASLQQRATTQGAEMAMQLYSQGVQQSQIADSIYAQLMGVQQEEDQQTTQAIGSFASALAGLGRAA